MEYMEYQMQRQIEGAIFHDRFDAVFKELDELPLNGEMPNCAGERDAQLSVKLSKAFIALLPSDLPIPEVALESDGCIELDWMPGTAVVSVSVGYYGRLATAWRINAVDGGYGCYSFDGTDISPELIKVLRLAHSNAASDTVHKNC